MIRDIIFFIHAIIVAIIAYILYKDNMLTSSTGLTMISSEIFIYILLVIPEVFFKSSKLAKILTKKII